jgi:hypothetical protein
MSSACERVTDLVIPPDHVTEGDDRDQDPGALGARASDARKRNNPLTDTPSVEKHEQMGGAFEGPSHLSIATTRSPTVGREGLDVPEALGGVGARHAAEDPHEP